MSSSFLLLLHSSSLGGLSSSLMVSSVRYTRALVLTSLVKTTNLKKSCALVKIKIQGFGLTARVSVNV